MIHWNKTNNSDNVARRFIEAMSTQDTPSILACLDDNYVRYGEESGWLPISKQHYQAMSDNFIDAFDGFFWELINKVTDGNTVAFQFIESAVFSKEWDVLGLTVPPNHQRYHQQTAIVCKVNEQGLIQSYSYTHDRAFNNSYGKIIAEAGVVASIPEAPKDAPQKLELRPQPSYAIEDCTPKNAAETVVLQLATALTRQDIDEAKKCLANNYTWHGEEQGWKPIQKSQVCDLAKGFGDAFPDYNWEVIDLLSEGNKVAVEFVETGTFTNPWHLHGKVIEPNQASYRSHNVAFFEINDDGLIASGKAVHDSGFHNQYSQLLGDICASAPA